MQQPKTAGANSKLDKTWGQRHSNKRIDRVVQSFGGKLDKVLDTINKIATRVEVLSSKIDEPTGRAKSRYRP
jgi:hypothetical protein